MGFINAGAHTAHTHRCTRTHTRQVEPAHDGMISGPLLSILMGEWLISPPLLLLLAQITYCTYKHTHSHTQIHTHALTAAQLWGWEGPYPSDERQSGRERERGGWAIVIEHRGNLTGRSTELSHFTHCGQLCAMAVCVQWVSHLIEGHRIDHHAGPGRQSPQKGDGDRVSTAVQEPGWDWGRGGGWVTGGSGKCAALGHLLHLEALWDLVLFWESLAKRNSSDLTV